MKLQVSVSKSRSLNIETWVVNVEWTGPAGRLQLLHTHNTGYNNVQRNTLTLERPPTLTPEADGLKYAYGAPNFK